MKYKIAEINIEIISDPPVDLKLLRVFEFSFNGKPHLKIFIRSCARIDVEENELLLDDQNKWFRNANGGTVAFLTNSITNNISVRIEGDKKWENVTISYLSNKERIETLIIEHACYTIFRILILYHQGILIHSSCFEWNGKGVVITAPSGTGKSTHVSLWERYFGAKVLNDDSPAIKIIEGKLRVYGNPWSGSSSKFMNASAPLTAIIVLEQAAENSIRRLDKEEATLKLIPRFFLPYYDKELLNIAFDFIDKIIEITPVYFLRCTPEKEAADIVAAAIGEIARRDIFCT